MGQGIDVTGGVKFPPRAIILVTSVATHFALLIVRSTNTAPTEIVANAPYKISSSRRPKKLASRRSLPSINKI